MANKRISSLDDITLVGGTSTPGLTASDIIPVTDVDDTTGSLQGTTKKVTVANLVAVAPQGDLESANNLSDLGDAATARTNLGLGTAATSASTDFSSAFFSTVSDTTTTRTLSNSDNKKVIIFTNSSDIDVTVPSGLTAGFSCTLVQGSTGKIIVNPGSGASVNTYNPGSGAQNTSAGQYAHLKLIPTGTDAYLLFGEATTQPFANAYSLEFDGTNDYLSTSSRISITGAKTITMWVQFQSNADIIIGSAAGSSGYWLYLHNTSALYARQAQLLTGSPTFSYNTWYHIAITSDGSSMTSYINAGNTTTGLTDYAFDIDTFAANNAGTANYFDGIIDEIGIWNTELSASEITEIYGASNARSFDLSTDSGNYSSSSSLQHWYRMGDNDSGSSSTVTDTIGSNNITVNGATSSSTIPT
jgi:hypothetical protein